MARVLAVFIASLMLAACVQIPDGTGSAPDVELLLSSPTAYPGSTIQVEAVVNKTRSASNYSYEWKSSDTQITLSKAPSSVAVFNVGVGAPVNRQITLTAIVKSNSGEQAEASIKVDIGNEPFVIVDGQTDLVQDPESKPIYLTGVYSGKQVNLKSDDEMASENYLIDVSPDGRFVFYTQLFINARWEARLFDTKTGLNHRVLLDFDNLNHNAVESFWSRDSEYLAVFAPHAQDDSSDRLYWLSIEGLSDDGADIDPTSEQISFERLIWSDNSQALGEQAYAALIDEGSVRVLNPASEFPVTAVLDENDMNFVEVNTGAIDWSTNQLFLLAKVKMTTSTADVNVQHLFRWSPDTELTTRLSGTSTTPVDSFESYVATQVAYVQGSQLKLHNGNESSNITLAESSVVTKGSFNYRWSPDGQRLGVLTKPSNAGNSGYWSIHSWASNVKLNLPVKWESVVDGPVVADWRWNENRASISVLQHNATADQNEIHIAAANEDASDVEAVSGIFASEPGEANSRMENLEQLLLRSASGEWQLYWGYDRTNNSTHMDVWAFNTKTQEVKNISRLSDSYEKPSSPGVFITADGFDSTEAVYAGNILYWISDHEILFSVSSANLTDEYLDLRYVDLKKNQPARSIVLNRDTLTVIEAIVTP